MQPVQRRHRNEPEAWLIFKPVCLTSIVLARASPTSIGIKPRINRPLSAWQIFEPLCLTSTVLARASPTSTEIQPRINRPLSPWQIFEPFCLTSTVLARASPTSIGIQPIINRSSFRQAHQVPVSTKVHRWPLVAASELSGSGHITRMTAGFFTHWKEKIVTLNTKQQGGGASMIDSAKKYTDGSLHDSSPCSPEKLEANVDPTVRANRQKAEGWAVQNTLHTCYHREWAGNATEAALAVRGP
ncbi:hypothetical protein B0H13DRAFT_1923733 [Mycena leptocephala]|nr:hypothetical protein B0H13DRAFT_1923733 [Mycena leptocephala]